MLSASLARSAGSAELDREVIALVHRTSPAPPAGRQAIHHGACTLQHAMTHHGSAARWSPLPANAHAGATTITTRWLSQRGFHLDEPTSSLATSAARLLDLSSEDNAAVQRPARA
ncbi:hypothetical protein [Bradyrhizobium sp. USDA 336]|uniref:hypothetical protein n=1 Tax=Bradyrhizobium sp. USDA 336 TaxID=3156311 RepID=UPI00384E7524